MNQREFRACVDGYQDRLEDQRSLNAEQAAWFVNNMPSPLAKQRKAVQPKELLQGKKQESKQFSNAEDLHKEMRKRAERQRGGV